jgi:Protein of unknown function (DUF2510)
MTSPPPPGWYSDPGGTTQLRWWNGQNWTAEMSPGMPAPPVTGFPQVPTQPGPVFGTPVPPQAQPSGYQPYLPSAVVQPQRSIWQANPHSTRALVVTAIYVVIAVATPFGLLGIVPIFASIRSLQAGERLAPAAVGAAALAFIVGMLKLTHHF